MVKQTKARILRLLAILKEPKQSFEQLYTRTFEEVLSDYLIALLQMAIFAGIVSFVYALGKAAYLYYAMTIEIELWPMINYMVGRSTSIIFLYLFLGTFMILAASLLLRIGFKKGKFYDFLKIIFYSLTPLLLFGWIPTITGGLLVWCLFLLSIGVTTTPQAETIKNSIKHRD
ncbi:MAG: hypothetical protein QW594_01370 [Candidatus Woesearchaeota archaeon]